MLSESEATATLFKNPKRQRKTFKNPKRQRKTFKNPKRKRSESENFASLRVAFRLKR
jgi:hypothetical protein